MKKRTFIASCVTSLLSIAFLPSLAQAQNNRPIKIALIASKTGPSEQYARDTERGLRMGLDYMTQGTMMLNGRKVELIVNGTPGPSANYTVK